MKELQTNQEEIQLSGINTTEQDFSSNTEADSYPAEYTANYENGYDTYGGMEKDGLQGDKTSDEFKTKDRETIFDPNEVTDRIGAVEGHNLMNLVDFDEKPIMYGKDDEQAGIVQVYEGMQVVKLEAHKDKPYLTQVLFWHKGKYRQGYIKTESLNVEVSEDNAYSKDAFLNDAEHILFRAKKRSKLYAKEKENWDGGKWLTSQFDLLIEEVENYLKSHEDGTLIITNEILQEIKIEEEKFKKLSEENPFHGTQKVQEDIFEAYNPQDNQGAKYSEETLTLPLSKKWFHSHPKLKSFSEIEYRESTAPLDNNSQAIVGSRAKKLKATLLELKEYVIQENIPQSEETDWLSELNASDLDQVIRIIVIGAGEWTEESQQEKYTAIVAKENSVGPLKAPSAMTIASHEMNVGLSIKPGQYGFLPGDSHISEDETKKYWDLANAGKFDSVENAFDMRGHMGTDSLFQIHSGLSLIYLKHCFQRISEKSN